MDDNNQISHNVKAHDLIASVYNFKHEEIYNPVEQKRLAEVVAKVISLTGKDHPTVLDYGAGTGNLTNLFLQKGCQVIALDISKKSLEILKQQYNHPNLQTKIFDGLTIPLPDNSIDIVATYSVLHHIPDYLSAISQMARVLSTNGLLYIDHEANDYKWQPDENLKKYYRLTKRNFFEYLSKKIKTRELFELSYYTNGFISLFVNKKHRREGDIHVWSDDHIEWNKIIDLFQNQHLKIIENIDYLMYKPKGGEKLYEEFKNNCHDTKYLICQKYQ
jgi:ubiquinone/menaquinone biosynthesis C-methylase UbiE